MPAFAKGYGGSVRDRLGDSKDPKMSRRGQGSLAESFNDIRASYAAARTSRFRRTRNVPLQGAAADYHYSSEADWLKMLEYARDMDRNDAVVGPVVNRAVANEIQDGLLPDPDTGNLDVDRMIADKWREWAEDADACDVAGELNFHEMEKLVSRHVKIDGDVMALPLESGALEIVESHRCRTPRNTKRNVVHGVLLDRSRRHLEYWFTKDEIDPWKQVNRVSDTLAYPVRDEDGNRILFHVLHPKRVSQTRGVTAFAPVFDLLGMFEDTNYAKLVAQQIMSCFTIFRERDINFTSGDNPILGATTTETLSDGQSQTTVNLSPGLQINGLPGETYKFGNPSIPDPQFFEHLKFILTLVGINLGLPLVLVLLDAKETNFSGWRGAVDQARLGFRSNQRQLIARFHRPVYLWKVRQWAFENPQWERKKGVVSLLKHKWNPPSWPYIEPMKDAQADALRLEKNLTSPRRLHAERGRDWSDVVDELVEDRAQLIERSIVRAQELSARLGVEVDWRLLAGLDVSAPAVFGNESDDSDEAEREERLSNG